MMAAGEKASIVYADCYKRVLIHLDGGLGREKALSIPCKDIRQQEA